jgi:hypothetical protein
MSEVKIDKATMDHLVEETRKVAAEGVTLPELKTMLAAHMGLNQADEFEFYSEQESMRALRVISKRDRNKLWEKVKAKLKEMICTPEVQEKLKGSDLEGALKVLFPLIFTAVGIVVPEAALMGLGVWIAAYLIKLEIYKFCGWPRK